MRVWSPADLAAAVLGGVACLLCRLPILPLACFIAPSPRPPSRREGGDQGYFMQGASPLASPGIRPPAALTDPAEAAPCGVACLLCRPLPLPLGCFVAPIPPAPFPSGEGGDSKIILPGATAPGTPALNRLRHLQTLSKRHPVGWLAFFVARYPSLWLALLPPSPRPPSPPGKGETKVISCKGLRPLHPRA